jgi:hypothetical protein
MSSGAVELDEGVLAVETGIYVCFSYSDELLYVMWK